MNTTYTTEERDAATMVLLRGALNRLERERDKYDDITMNAVGVQFAIRMLSGIYGLHGDTNANHKLVDMVEECMRQLHTVADLGMDQTVWMSEVKEVREAYWTIYSKVVPSCIEKLAVFLPESKVES
jgi:hypothetical protein